jgi:hypothetical protein
MTRFCGVLSVLAAHVEQATIYKRLTAGKRVIAALSSILHRSLAKQGFKANAGGSRSKDVAGDSRVKDKYKGLKGQRRAYN